MSKPEELIKSLRASAAAMPYDAAVAVQYMAAADALEAQAREIEGLRKDAERWISTAQVELDGVETEDANNCLKAARGALENAMAVVRGEQGAPHG